ncbi:MAG: hypothetical protein ABIK09_00945 [Pseudomonadota bacterium]
MPHCFAASTEVLLASPVGAPAMHMVLILTLLFAVVMLRLGRKDP